MSDYTFRPITQADHLMFKDWLDHPHMGGWWSDGATELRLLEQGKGKGPEDHDYVDMQIVALHGKPFAYIQDYNAQAFGGPQFAGFPDDARAIDTFLGDPAFLGQGHGAGYIAARLSQLRKSYPVILTDPDPANMRAVAAYTRAGFRPDKITPCEDGDPVQVMTYS